MTNRGMIIPIGGAEEKMRDARILKRFVEVCGGDDARIAIFMAAFGAAGPCAGAARRGWCLDRSTHHATRAFSIR